MDLRFRPIAVNGMTGTEPEPDRNTPGYVPPDGDPELRAAWEAAASADEQRYWNWRVARYHLRLIPLVQAAEPDWIALEAARADYEQAWEALTTATTDQWASAHYRWGQTHEPVRAALANYGLHLGSIDELHWGPIGGEATIEAYEQLVPDEVNLTKLHWNDAGELTRDFERKLQEREQAAARTLGHLQTA